MNSKTFVKLRDTITTNIKAYEKKRVSITFTEYAVVYYGKIRFVLIIPHVTGEELNEDALFYIVQMYYEKMKFCFDGCFAHSLAVTLRSFMCLCAYEPKKYMGHWHGMDCDSLINEMPYDLMDKNTWQGIVETWANAFEYMKKHKKCLYSLVVQAMERTGIHWMWA